MVEPIATVETPTLPRPSYKIEGNNVLFTNQEGSTQELKNAIVFNPEETAGKADSRRHKMLESLYGKDYQQKMEDKLVAVPYVFAGWGHLFQAYAQALELSRMGVKTALVDLQELATPQEQHNYLFEMAFLKTLHNKTGGGELKSLIRTNQGIKTLLSDLRMAAMCELAFAQLRALGFAEGQGLLDTPIRALTKLREIAPPLARLILHQSVQSETDIVAKPFQRGLLQFLKDTGTSYVVTTHSEPARALVGTEYEDKTILSIPDPGYAVDPNILQPLVVNSKKIIFGVPEDNKAKVLKTGGVAKVLYHMYDIPEENIIPVGTVSDRQEEQIIRDKWGNCDRERTILFSTAGNATHLDLMKRAASDFAQSLKAGGAKPYKMIFFLGNHPDEVVKPVLDEIKSHPELITDPNDPNYNCIVIRTSSDKETAYRKWLLKGMSLMEIGKPGENPLDAPVKGTTFLSLAPGAINERENLLYAIRNWNSAIPSAWPPESSFNYWRQAGIQVDAKTGFTGNWNNLFDYLDFIFGDNLAHVNLARERMLDGLSRARKHGAFNVAALAIGQLMDKPQYQFQGAFGRYAKKNLTDALIKFEHDEQQLEKVKQFLTYRAAEAGDHKDEIKQMLLELSGFKSEEDFIEGVANETAVITFLAGTGSRWKKSFNEPAGSQVASHLGIENNGEPRALAPVPNLLPRTIIDKDRIPIGTYNLFSVRDLGENIIIYSKPEDAVKMQTEIAQPLEMTPLYLAQQNREGQNSPSGHGDGLIQIKDRIKNKKYVITNFGSDANSRETCIMSLMTLYVLSKYGENTGVVIPTAYMEQPKYPVSLDLTGEPTGEMGHAKMLGDATVETSTKGFSNIGVRVYRNADLQEVLSYMANQYIGSDDKPTFEQLPGHEAKRVNECALDDIDRAMAQGINLFPYLGRARLLATALPEEITHSAKAVSDIPDFLRAQWRVLEENGIEEVSQEQLEQIIGSITTPEYEVIEN